MTLWEVYENDELIWPKENTYQVHDEVLCEIGTHVNKRYEIRKNSCVIAIIPPTEKRHSNHILIMRNGGYSVYPSIEP